MKKTLIAGLLLSCSLLGGFTAPARAADEGLQIQLLKQVFRLPQPEWPQMLNENRHLLDPTFFERCDARIRWGIENNQIEDAVRFSLVADTAMKVNGQKGKYRISLAYGFLKSGNETLAKDTVTNILFTDPDDVEAKFIMASILRAEGDLFNAYNTFKQMADSGYRRDECLYQMGVIDVVSDKADQGEKELQQCLQINPNHVGAKAELQRLAASRPKFVPGGGGFSDIPTPAKAGVAPVGSEAAAKARTIFNEAEAFTQVGELGKAKAAYLRALESDPGLVKCYIYLGALLYRQNELDGAVKYLRQGLQLDNKDREGWRYLGYCYERRFDSKGAKEDLEMAIACFQKGTQVAPDDRQYKTELERASGKKGAAAHRP